MVKPVYYGPKRTTSKNNPNKGLTAVQKMDLQAYRVANNFAASASQVANIPALPPGPAGAVVAPATKLPAPQGVEEQQHQYTFCITPYFESSTQKWMMRWEYTLANIIRRVNKTYGRWKAEADLANIQVLSYGITDFDALDVNAQRLHCIITHDYLSPGITSCTGPNAGARPMILQTALHRVPGAADFGNQQMYGQPENPFKSGFLDCNDSLGFFPKYDITTGPVGPGQGNTQGKPQVQMSPNPPNRTLSQLNKRGWMDIAVEAQDPRWQSQGVEFYDFGTYDGYPNQYVRDPLPNFFAARCQLKAGYRATVGVYQGSHGGNDVDKCSPALRDREECFKLTPCYLPGALPSTAPPGEPLQIDAEITPFRGLSQSEVESNERYRAIFWKWFLDNLGNRTDFANPERPGMDKYTEASEWVFRTDKMKISWMRDAISLFSYASYKDLRIDPLYANMTFDWKRNIRMPLN